MTTGETGSVPYLRMAPDGEHYAVDFHSIPTTGEYAAVRDAEAEDARWGEWSVYVLLASAALCVAVVLIAVLGARA